MTSLKDGIELKPNTVYPDRVNLYRAKLNNVDLSGSTLNRVYMPGAILDDANLSRAILKNGFLNDIFLRRADLTGTDFTGSQLLEATMNNAILIDTIFDSTHLMGSAFNDTTLNRVSFINADVSISIFINTVLERIDFRNAQLGIVNFSRATLTYVSFVDANLKGADFSRSTLDHVDFTNADLSINENAMGKFRTSFKGANLSGVDFTGANLRGVDFTGAVVDRDDIIRKANNITDTIGLIEGLPEPEPVHRLVPENVAVWDVPEMMESPIDDASLDAVYQYQSPDVDRLERYKSESCFDVINQSDEVIGNYLSDHDNLVIFYRPPNSDSFFANCLTFDTLKNYLKDPKYIFYECVDRKDFRTYHREAPQYLKIPGRTTIFVNYDIIKIKFMERQNMIFLEFERDVSKTITYSASNTMIHISSNHCQHGSSIPLYNVVF